MGQVKFAMEANEAKAVRAFMRVVDAQTKTEGAARRGVQANREHGRSFETMGGQAKSELAGMLESYAKIGVAIAAIKKGWELAMGASKSYMQAQMELGQKGYSFQTAALGVANQMGMGATDEGQKTGARILGELMTAGRFGQEWGRGEAAAVGAHVAWGESGKVLSGEAMEMAKTVVGYAGWKKIGEEATAGLFKTLVQSGADTPEEVRQRIEQFDFAYTKALSTKPEDFVKGATGFVGETMAQEQSFERGMAEFIQAVRVTKSEQAGAEMSRKMMELVRKEGLMEAVAGEAFPELAVVEMPEGVEAFSKGTRESVKKRAEEERNKRLQEKFVSLSMDERKRLMAEYINRHQKEELLLRETGLESGQIGWAVSMYGGQGQAEIAAIEEELRQRKGEGVPGLLKSFGGTTMGQTMAVETEGALAGGTTQDVTVLGTKVLDKYREQYTAAQGRDKEYPFWRHPTLKWFQWMGHEDEMQQDFAHRALGHRLEQFDELAKERGWEERHLVERRTGPASVSRTWEYPAEGAAYRKAREALQTAGEPTIFNPFTPREAGTIEKLLQELEALSKRLQENTKATEKNTVGTGTGPAVDPNIHVE